MKIDISDATYQAISQSHSDVSAFVEHAAKEALRKPAVNTEQARFEAEELISEFHSLQGMYGDASLEEVLNDRRDGIE